MLISRTALTIAKGVAAHDSPACAVVHVEPDGRVVATDGHILIVAVDQFRPPMEDFPSNDMPALTEITQAVDIPLQVVDRLIKAIPKKSTLPVLGFANVGVNGDGKQAYAVATDLEFPTIAKLDHDHRFPAWERVMVRDGDRQEIVKLTLSADMLASVAKIADLSRANKKALGAVTLEIPVSEPRVLTSIRFTAGSDVTIEGVLMPCGK